MGRTLLIWTALFCAIVVPIAASAMSPLLAWREPIYIAAGFAGVFGLALMLVQPMLVGGYLPGISRYRARRVHRSIGAALVSAVIVHVVGLWITSPPDVVDALLFRSPTPFSVWGVIAMWAIFAVALLALFRRRLRLRTWRVSHSLLAVVIVSGTVIHSLLIEGTMEVLSKVALCVLVIVVSAKAMLDLRVWAKRRTSRERTSAD